MADSVLFASASSERIECNKGTWVGTGAITIAVVFKLTTNTNESVCGLHSGAFVQRACLFLDATGNVTYVTSGGNPFDALDPITVANGWVILAITKPTGLTTPRIHIYRNPTWRHAAMSGTGSSSASTGFVIAASDPGEDFLNGNVLIAAGWDSELSDGSVALLSGGYQAWIDAAPKEGIRVNAVTGLTSFAAGGTMSETGHTGGTVDVGDIPSWWDDSTGGGVTPGPGDNPPIGTLGRGAGW